jgi:ribonuclease R
MIDRPPAPPVPPALPGVPELARWIAENPRATDREAARAFGIKGALRRPFRDLLRTAAARAAAEGREPEPSEGGDAPDLRPRRGKAGRRPVSGAEAGAAAGPPPVGVFEVMPPDPDGDLFARPFPPRPEDEGLRVLVIARPGDPALGAGDRILARVAPAAGPAGGFEARLIRRLAVAPRRIIGIFRRSGEGGRIQPIEKGADREWIVPRGATLEAREGELVEAEPVGPRARLGLPRASITARLGDPSGARAVSLIAIHDHAIPHIFADAALAEAEAAGPAPMAGREDLRDLPFVTIDPPDARDRDDAVCASPDDDPANPGGHVLWVAIADVAHYVRPQSALDREARLRGNSTYFPDRVVPMLPEALSGDLCSLHEGADRPCIAVRLHIDRDGRKLSHRFVRGMIRSRAALSYAQVQAVADGGTAGPGTIAPAVAALIPPLYAAHAALGRARAERGPLDLDLPEREIRFAEDGRIAEVGLRERFEAHRLIEEFMILANVAAAEELGRQRRPLLYRVHEEPSPEKLDALREVAQASGFVLARGQVLQPAHINRLLAQAEGTDFDELINITALRSMQQAFYAPENVGHFGLALREYAHFTSPIRRYSDLIVHRALISAHGWGGDGLSVADIEMLPETAERISQAERRSMAAERDTSDRYLALWLSERVGEVFEGRVSGVQRFGAFVRLDAGGADGLIPVRDLGGEFFRFDPEAQTLTGSATGLRVALGQRVRVRLVEAVPMTGGLRLEPVEFGPAGPGGAGAGRRPGKGAGRRERGGSGKSRTRSRVGRGRG